MFQEGPPIPLKSFDLPPEYEKFYEPRERIPDTEIRNNWKHETWNLNGKKIDFYGVAHVPETLELYGKEIEEAIIKSGIVVLEGAPTATGELEEDIKITVKTLKEIAAKLGKTNIVNWELVQKVLSRGKFRPFFARAEQFCQKNGKPIAIADPQTSGNANENARAIAIMHDENQVFRNFKVLTMLGGMGIIALDEICRQTSKHVRPLNADERGDVSEKSDGRQSRRGFLKILGGTVAAGAAASLYESADSFWHGRRAKDPFSALLYEYVDFRDVMSAEGLDRLSKQKDSPRNITCIYGDAHLEGIKYYSQSPKERALKIKAYAPMLDALKDVLPTLRQFRYNRQTNKWNITRQENLSEPAKSS
ncbi:MAG: hypothetical protein P4L74_06200 [Candidatus Doudnabacteria bacterium]|nr:hypothetical protein [Candidatus Doudnabacteria bacterium]